MDYPRFPDWLIYSAAAGAILIAAVGRREHADSPPAPPPPPGAEKVPLGPDSPFDPVTVIRTAAHKSQARGTAFAVGADGLWLTARDQTVGCDRLALQAAEGRAVEAHLEPVADPQLAILRTEGGPAPVLIARRAPDGLRGFAIGYPRGAPGEASMLLMSQTVLPRAGRDQMPVQAVLWAEAGRTGGMLGALPGLDGAPVFGPDRQVVGVILRQEQRRARFYAAGPGQIARMLAAVDATPRPSAPVESITVANYGRIADDLRRERQVAQVLCLRG